MNDGVEQDADNFSAQKTNANEESNHLNTSVKYYHLIKYLPPS